MVAHRLRRTLGIAVVGVLLAAAISFVSAQEGSWFIASMIDAGTGAGAAMAGDGDAAITLAVALEEEPARLDVTQAEVPPTVTEVAQTPPPPVPVVTAEEEAIATPSTILSERAWSDGVTTIVECTGVAARTCQVNVYGPDGQFILGRQIPSTGVAADCSGPCLDSTGVPLDASSISRAQQAIAGGNRTVQVITSAGAPLPSAAEVETPRDDRADPARDDFGD